MNPSEEQEPAPAHHADSQIPPEDLATKKAATPTLQTTKYSSRRNQRRIHFTEDVPLEAQEIAEQVSEYDVLCGRHRLAFHHAGNQRLRVLVAQNVDKYAQAGSRLEKTMVIRSVVDVIQSFGGRFIKWDRSQNAWTELTEKQAHEKVGHAFRDRCCATKEPPSLASNQNSPISRTSYDSPVSSEAALFSEPSSRKRSSPESIPTAATATANCFHSPPPSMDWKVTASDAAEESPFPFCCHKRPAIDNPPHHLLLDDDLAVNIMELVDQDIDRFLAVGSGSTSEYLPPPPTRQFSERDASVPSSNHHDFASLPAGGGDSGTAPAVDHADQPTAFVGVAAAEQHHPRSLQPDHEYSIFSLSDVFHHSDDDYRDGILHHDESEEDNLFLWSLFEDL